MLHELSIRDFAIIEQVHLTFSEGFHVLTGETGAGKSILFDALSLIVGGRGSADFVRHGAKKAEVEALFELTEDHRALIELKKLGLSLEDGCLVIRREVTQQGKSTCRINGQLVTLAMLRQAGEYLLDIHGQHEHQSLMRTEEHLSWLDAYGGPSLSEALNKYKKSFEKYQEVTRRLTTLDQSEKEIAQRIDLLTFQRDEIAAARLEAGEEEALFQEQNRLAHAEHLTHRSASAFELLYGEEQGGERLNRAVRDLEEVVRFDESLQEVLELVQSAYYQVEEAARQLGRYQDELEFDPVRLSEVNDRLTEIEQLKRKYGDTVEEIIAHGNEAATELEGLEHSDQVKQELMEQQASLLTILEEEAASLTQLRKKAAITLELRVEEELVDLNMKGTRIQVAFHDQVSNNGLRYTATGDDYVEFLIAPNPGEPPRPLAKIASGGELSRIMLALKTIFSDLDGINTLIFDEIDTGVSGRAAQAIAEKITRLGRNRQVLCVTHLPQVACMADIHFQISKETLEEKTRTRVKMLTEEGRVMELARMLGGVEVTKTTQTHALEMLQLAEKTKENM
ncbi:DNA repair protein RecN [Marininema halotolerans]|uniref:DNA repair protein RecN n=1 Tax=Marininema halotolerans TaxID=1155944 RepID=A0A1I6TUY9_9BACL|nr:DNA repair protein RecN [Marininema halotolerans]SFS92981.1 DNA repair protein RecN (Recombination protein N) [Marininema halotolerans]